MTFKPFSVSNSNVGSRTAAAGNVGSALSVRESKLLFVTEKGFIFQNDFFKEISGSMDNILYI